MMAVSSTSYTNSVTSELNSHKNKKCMSHISLVWKSTTLKWTNKKHTALFLALLHSSTVSLKFMGSPTRTVTFYKYNNTIFNYTFEGTVVINQENLGKCTVKQNGFFSYGNSLQNRIICGGIIPIIGQN